MKFSVKSDLTLQAFIKTGLPVNMGIVKEIRSVNRSLNRILGPSSLNNLPKDIEIYVDKHFPADQWQEVLSLLRHAVLHDGTTPAARTLRCALFASKSDLEKLDYYLNEIAIDYRDVIVAGEYELQDGELIQVRDLSKSFSTENKS